MKTKPMNEEQHSQRRNGELLRLLECYMHNFRRADGRECGRKPRKPPKQYWTTLNSAQYNIAFHRNGTVDVRVIGKDHCVIRMGDQVIKLLDRVTRIEPTGLVSVNGCRVPPSWLSGERMLNLVDEVTTAVRAWVDGAEGREMPTGLVRIPERLRKANEQTAPMITHEALDFRTAVLDAQLERRQRARALGEEPEPDTLWDYFDPF
jgi:hypothetical protein